MGFQSLATVERLLASPTVLAPAVGELLDLFAVRAGCDDPSVPPTQVCAIGSNQTLPSWLVKDWAMEYWPLAHLEQ